MNERFLPSSSNSRPAVAQWADTNPCAPVFSPPASVGEEGGKGLSQFRDLGGNSWAGGSGKTDASGGWKSEKEF